MAMTQVVITIDEVAKSIEAVIDETPGATPRTNHFRRYTVRSDAEPDYVTHPYLLEEGSDGQPTVTTLVDTYTDDFRYAVRRLMYELMMQVRENVHDDRQHAPYARQIDETAI